MAYKYGIDFGTTNSSIAICFVGEDQKKHTYVVERDREHPPFSVLPSLFYLDEKSIWVGDEAENKYCNQIGNVKGTLIKKIKLFLESKRQNLTYQVESRTYSGAEIIAELFRKLREDAEKHLDYLGIQMDGVVLGVPVAYDQIAKNVLVDDIMTAIRPAGIALILQAGIELFKLSITDYFAAVLFAAFFVLIYFWKKSPIFYIVLSAVVGILLEL